MKTVTTVLARLLLTTIFLGSGVNKIMDVSGTVEAMNAVGMPMAGVLVYGAIVFLLVGGVSVLVGYKARIGAGLLIVFLVLATYYFHAFWRVPDDQVQTQTIAFLHNIGLIGAMLFIVANGPGQGSVDVCGPKHGCGVKQSDSDNATTDLD